MSDPVIAVSLPRSDWETLLSLEPMAKETYTPEGIAIFNAFQAIHHAVGANTTVTLEKAKTPRFTVYDDPSQWVPFFKWFWIPGDWSTWEKVRPIDNVMGHGGYPARWIAWLSAWWHTRARKANQ